MIQKELLSMEEFLTFSARLNYLLASRQPSIEAIGNRISDGNLLSSGTREAFLDGISFLVYAYRNRSRRLGPSAVLHPLRTSHLLVLAMEKVSVLEILTAFLHDYLEDIYTPDLPKEKRIDLQKGFAQLQSHLAPEECSILNNRIDFLTRRSDENYHEYLGRLIEQSKEDPQLLWVKLSDRLDNTHDMRVFSDDDSDAFRLLFNILFVGHNYEPMMGETLAPVSAQMDEAHRLYQLFKNAIFLTLVRRYHLDSQHSITEKLFEALAFASSKEAGRVLSQLFTESITDIQKQRFLLMDAMSYCQGGGIERITPAQRGHRLDGFFKSRFDHADKKVRKQHLKDLQEDKELMVSVSMTFLVIFEKFLGSRHFNLGGIRATGLSDEDTLV